MEITNEQRKQLLEYLSRRPYSEVFTLIAMLLYGIGLKTLVFLACLIYWAIMILAHFSQ